MKKWITDSILLQNEAGLSILEVLISVSIMAIGILGVAALQYSTVNNNTTGNVFTQANMLAQIQMERLKNQDISTAALAPGNYVDPLNPINEFEQNGGIYNRSWTIANFGAFSRQVTVTVQWTRPGALNRRVVLTSTTRGSGI
ncbi:MAG: hypothetical protein A2V65_07865 [Deltaproteobacteria bacterium RBG_13_49_15]|nr:MAG: hypothetical protein A2V65_07865 [Deltaproteobacteria bacterium RBG_13_49_15]